jgi:hypothetical protein
MSEVYYKVCCCGPLLWFRELLFDEVPAFPKIDEFGSGCWAEVMFLLTSLFFLGSCFRLPVMS